jgi:hypothetical protein
MRIFPGLAPGDSFLVNDGKTRLSLRDAASGIKTIYDGLLNRAWADARERDGKLPSVAQKAIPPTVPGQQ